MEYSLWGLRYNINIQKYMFFFFRIWNTLYKNKRHWALGISFHSRMVLNILSTLETTTRKLSKLLPSHNTPRDLVNPSYIHLTCKIIYSYTFKMSREFFNNWNRTSWFPPAKKIIMFLDFTALHWEIQHSRNYIRICWSSWILAVTKNRSKTKHACFQLNEITQK